MSQGSGRGLESITAGSLGEADTALYFEQGVLQMGRKDTGEHLEGRIAHAKAQRLA